MTGSDWILLGIVGGGLMAAWGVSLVIDRWLQDGWPF